MLKGANSNNRKIRQRLGIFLLHFICKPVGDHTLRATRLAKLKLLQREETLHKYLRMFLS